MYVLALGVFYLISMSFPAHLQVWMYMIVKYMDIICCHMMIKKSYLLFIGVSLVSQEIVKIVDTFYMWSTYTPTT